MRLLPYDRQSAVAYTRTWALSRNPAYYDFSDLGGDCTNFASQAVYAGAGVMNVTPVTGWFYRTANDRTASWTGVEFFYDFLSKNLSAGPFGRWAALSEIRPGDVIQLSFDGERFAHTPVALSVGDPPAPENILVAAHTNDALDRPLSTYAFRRLRPIHIEGVRQWD